MLPDWVSNPGPLTYESGALPIALRGPAGVKERPYKQSIKYLLSSICKKYMYIALDEKWDCIINSK